MAWSSAKHDILRAPDGSRIRVTFPADVVRGERMNRRGNMAFSLRRHAQHTAGYDREKKTPVIRCSICTGEQVAGFRDRETGRFEEVMLIRSEADLRDFREQYGITGEIQRIY